MTTNFTTPAEDQMQTLASRFALLMADDPQFRDAAPSEAVTAAKTERELRMAQIVATTMEGYADRPALGERPFSHDHQTTLYGLPVRSAAAWMNRT
jgi:hypothetical protein